MIDDALFQTKAFTDGANPALYQDIENIVNAMPALLKTKKEEASLYFYSVSCGARSSTCANVLVQDIENVEHDGKGNYTIKVSTEVFKSMNILTTN